MIAGILLGRVGGEAKKFPSLNLAAVADLVFGTSWYFTCAGSELKLSRVRLMDEMLRS
jgi:hypothetical protein